MDKNRRAIMHTFAERHDTVGLDGKQVAVKIIGFEPMRRLVLGFSPDASIEGGQGRLVHGRKIGGTGGLSKGSFVFRKKHSCG